ncbi:uncharacterized protein LOC132269981 [Cornus florida]|uniref:uncharacterized protein LOC132269981 n=1 Tax=Cornus florida TaxID=4283 RepID=UPI00289DF4E4|nr:uncharacterized protein LOC132269981 [Cornus florida]
MTAFPRAACEFLPHGISDHSPMVVKFGPQSPKKNLPFRFFNFWTLNEKFLDIVQQGWSMHFRGTKMFSVVQRLRALKGPLKALNRKEFGAISRKVATCKEELEQCQRSLDLNPIDDLLRVNERDLANKYSELCLAEEMFYKQKAQVHWLKVGDQNTAYFMKAFSSKSNKRKIIAIEDLNGSSIQGQELQNEFLRHFQGLLGQSYSQYPGMNTFTDLFTKRVPSHFLSQLIAIPSDLDIKNCILSFHLYKALGQMASIIASSSTLGLLLDLM